MMQQSFESLTSRLIIPSSAMASQLGFQLPWSKNVTECKAAKDFTVQERGQDKYQYYRRDVFWSKVAELVRAGFTSDRACDKIYDVYGGNMSVTKIINAMIVDKKIGGIHI